MFGAICKFKSFCWTLECAIVNKKACASQISRVCRHFVFGCSNSARRKSGKCRRYFDDPLYFVDVKMLGLAFRVDGKILYKACKIARCNTERCRNLRAREFGSRFRSQFAKWEKVLRKHYLCKDTHACFVGNSH